MFSLLLRSRPAVSIRLVSPSLNKSRSFSSSPAEINRAIIYSQNGNPTDVLSVLTYPSLPPPTPRTVNIRFLLSPINPADINVIEGVYPAKPTLTSSLARSGKGSSEEPVFIGGNEGLATVTAVGENVAGLKVGDWVVSVKQQAGTWSSSRNVHLEDVVKLPDYRGLSEIQAATITVNPPTAYNMLSDYVQLKEGDWIMQNGANSAVGQAVIQIAATRGFKTLNFVRNRDDMTQLREQLQTLGASQVLTYDDLNDKNLRDKVKNWLGGKEIRLALNCVGGRVTTSMLRYMGHDGHLVSYGAMSKQPLSLPTSAFIFKSLTAHGFWQSRWYRDHSIAEREKLMVSLTQLMREGKLRAPEHELVSINRRDSDYEATNKIRDIFQRLAAGRYGRKIILKFEK